ncbi:MAG: pseudaminic acid biosynthesis-associated methylase [Pseudomonas sp.]|uniref:pseudaminic acid biosynthesis-associated methylase n=1 Tax=Pseudomonas abieticivorans TaxID=2931382 RepID=UPI0020BD6BA0|nr:pseudaminic acid biosynthesis-associated methylase [Pseudomonas sp. PIA16]MDE1164323.1 pseudaminic acid biosynthesis-associated methylase [Pseudomonas sp.]
MRELSEQEHFWSGDFGDQYVVRNQSDTHIASNLVLFAKALANTSPISSLLELGSGSGNALKALRQLLPGCDLYGAEINAKACHHAQAANVAHVWQGSLFDYPRERTFELTLSKGVLIHLAPQMLPAAYGQLYELSQRYILICEYYNPTPVEVSYRGHGGKLFKRDFAGEMLDRYSDLTLLDYGFFYRRDCNFPMDDTHWFLLEKRS